MHANRDFDVQVLPQCSTLRLDAMDLPSGSAIAQVVDYRGAKVWEGSTSVQNDAARVALPQLSDSGLYFLRLYKQQAQSDPRLLREFVFRVQ